PVALAITHRGPRDVAEWSMVGGWSGFEHPASNRRCPMPASEIRCCASKLWQGSDDARGHADVPGATDDEAGLVGGRTPERLRNQQQIRIGNSPRQSRWALRHGGASAGGLASNFFGGKFRRWAGRDSPPRSQRRSRWSMVGGLAWIRCSPSWASMY